MNFTVDPHAIRERLASTTMEEANMGADTPDDLVVDYFRSERFVFDPLDGGLLDDTLRLLVAVEPFGPHVRIEYLWAGIANDERYDRIVFRSPAKEPDRTGGHFADVSLLHFDRFPGGDVADAVEYVALAAAKALSRAGS